VNKREDILKDLVESIDLKELSLAQAALGTVAAVAVWKQFKLPKPSKYSQRSSVIDYAKSLVNAKNNKVTVAAVVGLLNISARLLLSIPELRDLGHSVMKVVQSERLEDFME